jgi:hypothetical protein
MYKQQAIYNMKTRKAEFCTIIRERESVKVIKFRRFEEMLTILHSSDWKRVWPMPSTFHS